jgi:hypothetical protein
MNTRLQALRPFCLALLLALAVQIAWAWACGFLGSSFVESGAQRDHFYENLRFTAAGAPVIERYTYRLHPSYEQQVSYLQAGDRQGIDPPQLAPLPAAHLAATAGFTNNQTRRVIPAALGRGRLMATGGVQATAQQVTNGVFFVLSDADMRRGYFELFDTNTRKRLGYLGALGFRETQPPTEEQFVAAAEDRMLVQSNQGILWPTDPEQLWGQIISSTGAPASAVRVSDQSPGFPFHPGQAVLLSGGRALLVDFGKRTVEPICPEEGVSGITLVARSEAAIPGDAAQSGEVVLYVAARLPDRVLLLHPQAQLRYELQLPADATADAISIQYLTDGTAVLQQSDRWSGWPNRTGEIDQRVRTWTVAAGGLITGSAAYQLKNDLSGFVDDETSKHLITLCAGAPLPAAVTTALIPTVDYLRGDATYGERLGNTLRTVWPAVLLTLVAGAAAAWLTWRSETLRWDSVRWTWVVFAFLLGLPGYAGYRLHQRSPHAGPLPEPALLGTEVLSPLPAA